MRAYTNNNGKTEITIYPQEDPEFEKRLQRIRELKDELDKAVTELMFYSHKFSLTCNFTLTSEEDE